MKVLMLSWEYPPIMVGGLGRHVYAIAQALVRRGHQVTVLTRHADGAPLDEVAAGVRVVRVPEDPPLVPLAGPTLLAWAATFNHTLTRAALRLAAAEHFDVLHAHDWLVAHSSVTLREQLGVPLVTTIHATEAGRHQGWLPEQQNRSIHSVECWLANVSDRVIVCSHYMRWEVSRLFAVPAGRIDVVVNGVEPHLWRPGAHAVRDARRRYAGAGPLIGFAGRLVYEKGVQYLVAALEPLRTRHPGLRLVVAGDGPYRPRLVEQIAEAGLTGAVSLPGFLGADLAATMAATDAMVVPSIYEPFGMVALEAAASGAPVAAAATGGLREIVEPGRTGMTFPAADPEGLARVVTRVLTDGGATRRMARTARHVVVDRYSWDAIADRTARVYERTRPGSATGLTGKVEIADGNLLELEPVRQPG